MNAPQQDSNVGDNPALPEQFREPRSSVMLAEGLGSGKRSKGASRGMAEAVRGDVALCVFWAAGGCYALDAAFVVEATAVPELQTVPATPSELVGMCNLRGTALAVVDLAEALNLPIQSERAQPNALGGHVILVLELGQLRVGARIERIEGVTNCALNRVRSTEGKGEHPAVKGVAAVDLRGGLNATVLDGNHLTQRLEELRERIRGGGRRPDNA